jgi:plastocyanin
MLMLFGLLGLECQTCLGGDLSVSIQDLAGHGVSDVVVTATPLDGRASPSTPAATAVMDQQHLAFMPRVLVVAVGTSVEFPNSDSVSHQVYSFSPAKKFQLPLYKGQSHPPVLFEHAGLVVLGCNIHDQMVGYIYVTEAPYFGQSDSSGVLRLQELKGGTYRLTLWSPLIADSSATLERTVHVEAGASSVERVQLKQPLRPRPEPRPHRGDWEY